MSARTATARRMAGAGAGARHHASREASRGSHMSARTWRSPCSSGIRCLGASCQPDCSYARQVIPLAIVFALLDALRRVLLRPYDPHRSAGRLVAASVAFLCADGHRSFADRQACEGGRPRAWHLRLWLSHMGTWWELTVPVLEKQVHSQDRGLAALIHAARRVSARLNHATKFRAPAWLPSVEESEQLAELRSILVAKP